MKETLSAKKYRSLLVSLLGGVVLFLVFVGGGAVWCGGFGQLMAKISGNAVFVRPKMLDLGSLEAGIETVAVFKMTNLVSGDISVVGERSSCDCAFSEKIPIVIPPGKTIDIKISVRLPKYDSSYDQSLVFMVAEPSRLGLHPVRVTATIPHPLPRPSNVGSESVVPVLAPVIEGSKNW
jgi:hypothetical protein